MQSPDERDRWTNELTGRIAGSSVQAGSIAGGVHITAPGAASPPGPPLPAPAQLPPPGLFANRRAELRRLAALAEEPGPGPVVLTGPGGVGKTTLALHWLHEIKDGYDGQLFIDLRGFSGGEPLPPDEPLERFLRALGAAPEHIPVGADEQSALFRSMTAGRRLVIMLDNAVSAAQVRPLLPGDGPALVVVTSRHRLTGLVVDGARFLDVDPLGEPGALELLERLIGADRIGAERDHARDLVALCGTLPLAVCASGARLAARRRWPIARAVAELGDEARRLAALRTREGDISVGAVFNTSYQALDEEQAAAYRLLGVHPGPDLCAAAAAALIGTDEDDAARLMDGLVDASLLQERPEDRYGFHDLVRLHARDQSLAPAADRAAAFERLADWYLATAVAADRTLMPGRWHLGERYAEPRDDRFASRGQALDWLALERPNLAAVAQEAHDTGLHAVAWQLAEAMWPLFLQRRHYPSWIRMYELGRAAAESCGDAKAQARMLEGLGVARLNLQEFGTATVHYEAALGLERQAGHRLGEASALEGLGVAALATRDASRAIELFSEARDVHVDLGRSRGIALMDRHIGEALSVAGRHDEAEATLTRVLERFDRRDEPYHHARTLTCLGQARLRAGRPAEAAAALRESQEVAREADAPHVEAGALRELARIAERLDDPAAERLLLEQALAIYTALASPQAAEVSERLAELPPAPSGGP
ncbi:NB-ARC domain-containing protein [Actinomadura meyerae]|uniref:NB-ARC domain-containing protein n=1 Tax=Actinomadura meyerae TaxID=240840 RepID=A0A239MLE5_9ACTN|nr:tetratricopeptide repeat protein [Actinomadura meyerae]SNT42788.1 NB-ARC domain-containing protein [Actinomadura meyerae]